MKILVYLFMSLGALSVQAQTDGDTEFKTVCSKILLIPRYSFSEINEGLNRVNGKVISISAPTLSLSGYGKRNATVCVNVQSQKSKATNLSAKLVCGFGYREEAEENMTKNLNQTGSPFVSMSNLVVAVGGHTSNDRLLCVTGLVQTNP